MVKLRPAAAAVALLLASACSGSTDPEENGESSPSTSSRTPQAATTRPSAPPKPTGPPELTASPADISWDRLSSHEGPLITRVEGGTLTVDKSRRSVLVETARVDRVIEAGPDRRIDEMLVDPPYAVVVAEDVREERPARAQVLDLGTGEIRLLGEGSGIPLSAGGAWAVGGGRVAYPTPRGNKYCIVVAPLSTLQGVVAHCVPPRNGLSQFSLSQDALGFLSFDDRRPVSCRTVSTIELRRQRKSEASAEARPCKAWEIVGLPDGSTVWSELKSEQRVEQASFFVAEADGSVSSLGTGMTGTLTWCDGGAYFSQDQLKDGGPGRLLRWSPEGGFQEVYQSPPAGVLTMSQVRCAGDRISLTVHGSRSTQVAARLN